MTGRNDMDLRGKGKEKTCEINNCYLKICGILLEYMIVYIIYII